MCMHHLNHNAQKSSVAKKSYTIFLYLVLGGSLRGSGQFLVLSCISLHKLELSRKSSCFKFYKIFFLSFLGKMNSRKKST